MAPCTTAIISNVSEAKQGVAASVNHTTREVGTALGVALFGGLLSASYPDQVATATAGLPGSRARGEPRVGRWGARSGFADGRRRGRGPRGCGAGGVPRRHPRSLPGDDVRDGGGRCDRRALGALRARGSWAAFRSLGGTRHSSQAAASANGVAPVAAQLNGANGATSVNGSGEIRIRQAGPRDRRRRPGGGAREVRGRGLVAHREPDGGHRRPRRRPADARGLRARAPGRSVCADTRDGGAIQARRALGIVDPPD